MMTRLLTGSLNAQIAYHMGEANRLSMVYAGNAGDDPDAAGSLNAQIAYHMGDLEQAFNGSAGNAGDDGGC